MPCLRTLSFDSPNRIVSTASTLQDILADVLSLGDRAKRLTPDTALLGSIPELDSMAVVSLLTAIEERFGIAIGDDEISAETFATFGSLTQFVDAKVAADA